MRIWVTGAGGGLGKQVCCVVRARGHELLSTTHWECPIEELGQAIRFARDNKPDAIINCAGRLPGAPALEMIEANTLGPHVLASTKIPLVHMSTDCVFSGLAYETFSMTPLQASDPADPLDLYGRTKLAGEPAASHVLVVRGSFLDPDARFLHWLLHAEGEIKVWERAWWNGTSVERMAEELVKLAEKGCSGIVHVASITSMTKADIARYLADKLELPVTLRPVKEPWIYRTLAPDVELPPVETLLAELVEQLRVEMPV